MSKRMLLSLGVILFLWGSAWAQTVVYEGSGTLSQAITDAASGDVLVLESGGIYTEPFDTAYHIDKSLTIMAEEGAAARPVLKMNAVEYTPSYDPESGPSFFIMEDGGSLTLKGLEFDGRVDSPDTASFVPVMNLFYWPVDSNKAISSIKVYDCYVHNMMNKIFAGYDSDLSDMYNVNVDTLIIEKSLFKYVDAIKAQYVGLDYLKVENCTFWDMPDFGIYLRGIGGQNAIVNHCTFHNVGNSIYGNTSTDPPVRLRMDTPANAVVKNSIFSNHEDEEAIEIDPVITGEVSHCLFFDYTVEPALGDIVPTDTIWADPQFADAANGDFTLAGDSPAVGAADDGTAMGDSRWDPTPVSIRSDVQVPEHFALAQNYPNPFNPTTSIQFSLAESGYTVLTVYNMLGQEVTTLLNTELRSGTHEVTFDAADLPSGIYFYRIQSGEYTAVKKMLLLK